ILLSRRTWRTAAADRSHLRRGEAVPRPATGRKDEAAPQPQQQRLHAVARPCPAAYDIEQKPAEAERKRELFRQARARPERSRRGREEGLAGPEPVARQPARLQGN